MPPCVRRQTERRAVAANAKAARNVRFCDRRKRATCDHCDIMWTLLELYHFSADLTLTIDGQYVYSPELLRILMRIKKNWSFIV